MKGDYSRDTFDPLKHFTRVLMQQGRVTLDSDWNEQAAILLHYLQTLAADLIGPHGGPAASVGFKIDLVPLKGNSTVLDDLRIGTGRYYVDGILCENEPPPAPAEAIKYGKDTAQTSSAYPQPQQPQKAAARSFMRGYGVTGDMKGQEGSRPDFITFFKQPDYPLKRDGFKFPEGPFLILLDVFERHVTALEDPSIQEVALGGPDTAARAKTVWQVRLFPLPQEVLEEIDPKDVTCERLQPEDLGHLRELLEPGARPALRARTREPEDINATNPCTVAPDARYRGAENQLYRVEIHRGDVEGGEVGDPANGPTFKFSRDNGSNVFPVLTLADRTVTLASLGRDDLSSLDVGDWVELVDDDDALLGVVRPLYQVESVSDPISMQVTLSAAPSITIEDASKHPLLRRWDQQKGMDPSTGGLELGSDGAALVVEGSGELGWLELEDGIQIQFQPGATYRSGDYWLIPARTATGDVEWPRTDGEPDALPPRGVMHHYAPLAIVYEEQGTFKLNDLRRTWDYLGRCSTCPTISVDAPQSLDAGKPVTFKAKLTDLPQGAKPTYDWKLNPDVGISSGQGTDTISVTNTAALGGQSLTATVNVSGLAANCPNHASGSTKFSKVTTQAQPKVTVNGPATVLDGLNVNYTAVPSDFPQGAKLNYNWTAEPTAAKIISGQGTPQLVVQSRGLGGQNITATVNVDDGTTLKATGKATTAVTKTTFTGSGTAGTATTTASKKRSGGRQSSQRNAERDAERTEPEGNEEESKE